jgi:hypothetical protein
LPGPKQNLSPAPVASLAALVSEHGVRENHCLS